MILVVIGIVIATTTTTTTTTTATTTANTTTINNITMTVYDFTSTPNPFICETKWIGDGICDDETNLFKCGFDDGDCCLNEVVDTNCYKCICHIDGKKHQMTTTHQMLTTTTPITPMDGRVDPPFEIKNTFFVDVFSHSFLLFQCPNSSS